MPDHAGGGRDAGRVLGLDFGLRRIGVATGSSRSGGSQALTMLRARDGAPNWGELGKLIDTWKPEKLLVGLPLHMDGKDSDSATRARGFGAAARRRFGLEVEFVDERLTTRAAENLLAESAAPGKSQAARRRKHRDSLAAELIVRAYLERGAHA
ncbi:MAG: Holliday junction resolvase RuvX [Gammaproteobacteria bacterium]|nr:Holliday junction resolvase RuvX [Gammaproteobacteria bacterium]